VREKAWEEILAFIGDKSGQISGNDLVFVSGDFNTPR
jgi:hypothetical protein